MFYYIYIYVCSVDCQKKDWSEHKKYCKQIKVSGSGSQQIKKNVQDCSGYTVYCDMKKSFAAQSLQMSDEGPAPSWRQYMLHCNKNGFDFPLTVQEEKKYENENKYDFLSNQDNFIKLFKLGLELRQSTLMDHLHGGNAPALTERSIIQDKKKKKAVKIRYQ